MCGRRDKPMPDRTDQPSSAPPSTHWPNPANEQDLAREAQRRGLDKDNPDLEELDPKDLHSAAPADGTGVTGTVRPA